MSLPAGKLINEVTGEGVDLEETSAIGRSPESAVVIADPRVSRKHALIRRQDDGFWFFDLGSVNGSYLNGRRVTTSQPLTSGDRIRIADHQYRFEGSGPEGGPLAGEATIVDMRSQDALLLVSDIQDFTALSEKLAPDELAPIIGTWYEQTERILDAHGATLDKFIGDSVLAYWLDTSAAARLAALQTADAMQRACEEVGRAHEAVLSGEGLAFRSGAAIHLGPTAYGAFGAQEFTLIGDAVNLAFRLEALTRELDERVLVSAAVLEGWEEGARYCRPAGRHTVKGRAQDVEVFALEHVPGE